MRKRMKRFLKKSVLNQIRASIHRFDEFELTELIVAIIQRYKDLHPDYEMVCFTLPADPEKRTWELNSIQKKFTS